VLPLLRECGIAPDVLVQLDTLPLQEHFHHPDDSFPNSVLLSLSMAPIRSFAPRFRQLFFIDSFDLSVLPNPARLRESWLSSLLACLGATEALHAPKVLLAGVDLRLLGSNVYYSEAGKSLDAPSRTDPLSSSGDKLFTADASGHEARTTLQFFATAAEAELFARAINANLGTTFHNLSPWSLLDPEVCPPISAEQALAAPELDKSSFLEKADQAAAMKEHVQLEALRAQYSRELEEAERSRGILACMRFADPEARQRHPCYQYAAANFPWFRPSGPDNLARVAEKLADELCSVTRFARNVAALHCQAAKNAPVPVLCTAAEEEEVVARLNRLRPGWAWRFMGIQAPNSDRPQPSSGCVALAVLHDWMRFQKVLIVAPGCASEFRYALSLIGSDTAVALEELLEASPQG